MPDLSLVVVAAAVGVVWIVGLAVPVTASCSRGEDWGSTVDTRNLT